MEHADAQGEEAGDSGLPALLRAHGAFDNVADHHDLTGRPRYSTATRRPR
jgi:release factor glutamine methyltransferase